MENISFSTKSELGKFKYNLHQRGRVRFPSKVTISTEWCSGFPHARKNNNVWLGFLLNEHRQALP